MNTGNMQGMMGPRGGTLGNLPMANGQQRPPQQGMQPFQRDVITALHKDPILLGWQKGVPLQPRAIFIFQLVTALRLLPKQIDLSEAVNVACAFERTTLMESPDMAEYDAACQNKLRVICTAREKQAQNLESQYRNPQQAQMGIGMPQMQMQMQSQARNGMQNTKNPHFQAGYQPQFQGSMQTSRMPMQQQQYNTADGLNLAQAPIQQMPQLQNIPQNTPRQVPQNAGQVNITAQENQQINLMAQQLRVSTSPQELEGIKERIRNAAPNQKMLWEQQRIDPMALWFRRSAATKFMNQKARGVLAQQQVQPNIPDGLPVTPQQPHASISNTSNPANQQFGSTPGTQAFDPVFGGNMQQFGSQILGLQQQGLRSQEEGQVVVPASGAPTAPPQHQQQGVGQAITQHPSMNQPNTSRSNANHPQFLLQQEKMQQVARMQAQAQIQNAGGVQLQPSQHNILQGQAGGLNMSQMIPQQSPAMPNLNRPIGPSMQQQQQQNYGTPQARQHSSVPQNQTTDGAPQNQRMQQVQGANNGLSAPQIGNEQWKNLQLPDMRQFPVSVQQKLASLPPEQQKPFLLNLQRARMTNMARAKALNGLSSGQEYIGDHQPPSNGQRPVQRNQGHPSDVQNPGAFLPTAIPLQDASLMAKPGQQPASAQGLEQRPLQQPQQLNQPRMSQAAASHMSEEQVQRMDLQPYPPNILTNQVEDSLPPQGVRLWGDLKAWVAQNIDSMPPGILDKLKNLQGLHFQNLVTRQSVTVQAQKARLLGQNLVPQTSTPFQQPGPAPPAQMVPTRSNQPLTHATTMPRTLSESQPPSAEQILNLRNRFPQMKDWPENRIGEVMLQRKRVYMEQLAQHQATNTQQAQYENLQRAQNQQPQRQVFMPNMQSEQGHSQQATIQAQQAIPNSTKAPALLNGLSAVRNNSQAQQARGAARPANPPQPLPSQKGTKRTNEDDVIEVPNPNIALQQHRRLQQSGKQGTSAQNTNASQARREQPPATVQHQQLQQPSQYELELRKQAAQTTAVSQQQQLGLRPNVVPDHAPQSGEEHEKMKQNIKFKQILNEVAQSLPHRKSILVDPPTRERMVQLLKENVEVIKRVQSIEQVFYGLTRNEEMTKDLIRTRIMTMKQYQDENFNIVDEFTMTAQELDVSIVRLKQSFSNVLKHYKGPSTMAKPQQQMGNTLPNAVNSPNLVPKSRAREPDSQPRQAVRQTPMQRMHSSRENRAPAAPTSDKAPFSFSAQSPPPDGVPQAYGPTQLTQDRLVIPPPKKRKVQSQGAGPAGSSAQQNAAQSVTSPQIQKVSSPRGSKPGSTSNAIKCSVPFCEVQDRGFNTVEDLARHTKENHQAVEPEIDDPLEWALEGVRIGLGINADGKINDVKQQKEESSVSAPPVLKQSGSSQGQSIAKLDVGTPMIRNPTQAGSHNILSLSRTLQPGGGSAKMPVLESRVAVPKSTRVDAADAVSTAKDPITPPHDEWDDITISPGQLAAYFPRAIDLQGGVDLLTLTPESTSPSAGSDNNSPQKSDIDEYDELQIKLEADSWIPATFFYDCAFPRVDIPTVDTDILGIGWESTFGPVQIEESKVGGDKRANAVAASNSFDASLFSFDP